MPCADFDELLSAYADGQTVSAQSEFLELHLQTCRRCQELLRQYRETRRLIQSAIDDRWAPPDLGRRISAAYRAPAIRPRSLIALAAVAALLCTLAAVLGSGSLRSAAPDALQSGRLVASALNVPTPRARAAVPGRFAKVYGHTVPMTLARELAYDIAASAPSAPAVSKAQARAAPPTHTNAVLNSKGGETRTGILQRQRGPLAR